MSNQELVLHLEENFKICSILTEGCINSLRFILISPNVNSYVQKPFFCLAVKQTC